VAHQQGRRPVSRLRQVIGVLLVLAALGVFLGYRHFTAEDRLRYYAERWLAGFTGGEVHVDRLEFSPFEGLNLVGVTIATPASAAFYPPETSLEDRTIFSAGTLLLRLQPFSIISGDLAVPAIVAVNPKLTLVDRVADGLGNWEVMFAHRKPGKPGKGRIRLPEIRLRNVEVHQYRLTDRGRAGGGVQTLYAGAVPLADKPQVYDLQVTKIVAGQDDRTWTGEAGRLQIDMETNAISGSLPSLSLEELLFVAPPEINRWLDILRLAGYVRAETFRFDPKTGAQASLTLRDARLSVPIDETEAKDVSVPRYIQFTNVAGKIRFDGSAADVEFRAMFRDRSPVQVNGRLVLPADSALGMSDISLDLDLVATGVPLPRCDETTPEPEKHFVRRFNRVAAFVHDFDGRGNVDLTVKLHKEAGAGKGIEFVEGVLTVRGASAAFEEFPYRLDEMSGEVRFRRDGTIDLINLAGNHGTARAVVNGHLGGNTSHDTILLNIQGKNVPVDEDLLAHLPERDREVCRNFLQRATVDVDVHLERTSWAWGGVRPPWTSSIEANFLDGIFRYAGFPYLMEGLCGRIRIAEGLMRLDNLTGRHGTGTVRASGSVTRAENEPASLDIQLRATDIPFDNALAAAMPAEVQKLYGQCDPAGRVSVNGRLHMPAPGAPLQYELTARLDQSEVSLPTGETSTADGGGAVARLSGVQAQLQITPAELVIPSLQGRLGESMVRLDGRLALANDRPDMSVHLASDSLELGPHVRAALPAVLRADYDSLAPAGRVRVDVKISQTSRATATQAAVSSNPAPASAPVTTRPVEYMAVVEPLDCRLTFAHFPLPLEKVKGKIILTPSLVELERLSAQHGDMDLLLAGQIRFKDDSTVVDIPFLQARHVTFTEDLHQAVPWRLRLLWADMKPKGTCDFLLNNIVFNRGPGENRSWQIEGKLTFKQMDLTAGPEFTGADGTLEGRLGFDEQFHIDARLALEQARVDGRLVTNASARVQRPVGSSTLSIRDLNATFYKGGLLGGVEVDYASHPPTYSLDLTARGISLEDFLNDRRPPDRKPLQVKGSISGSMAVIGQFNNPAARQGGGSVVIQDAQVLKLPLILSIFQIGRLGAPDDNAFHDALFDFVVDGDDLILERIDLRGKAVSMVGAGRVSMTDTAMHLVLLVGSPLKLPRVAVLSELMEGVARELMEVHVEGTLDKPLFRAELVRSLRRTIEAMTKVRVDRGNRSRSPRKE
jgi:hypothetical protein